MEFISKVREERVHLIQTISIRGNLYKPQFSCNSTFSSGFLYPSQGSLSCYFVFQNKSWAQAFHQGQQAKYVYINSNIELYVYICELVNNINIFFPIIQKKRRTKLSAFTVIFLETLLISHNVLHEKDDWYRCGLLLLCRAVELLFEIETQVPNSDFIWLSHGKVLSRLCGLCWPDIWKCLCKWWREFVF